MSCTVTVDGPCKRTIRFTLERDAIARRVEEGLRRLAPRLQLKGFRPGKVPLAVVRRTHGARLEEDVRNELLSEELGKCLAEHELRVVGRPKLSSGAEPPGDTGPLSFEVDVEVMPEFELGEVAGIEVQVALPPLGDAAVDHEIQGLRRRAATLEDAPEGAEVGPDDMLGATVVYRVGDETLPARADRPVLVQHELVDGVRVEGLAGRLVGCRKGDTVTLSVPELPPHVDPARLAGRPAELVVTIDAHRRLVVPPLDEALLSRLGLASEAELRERVREQLEVARKRLRDQQLDRAVEDRLLERHDFELPERFLAESVERRVHEYAHRLVDEQQMSSEEGHARAEAERGRIAELTRRGLRVSFILSRVARDKDVVATEDEARNQIAGLARLQKQDPDAVVAEAEREGWLNDVRAQLTEEKVRRWLREQARVTETTIEPTPSQAEPGAGAAEAPSGG